MTDDDRREHAKVGLRVLTEIASNKDMAAAVRVKAAAAILGVDTDEDEDEDGDDATDPNLARVEAARILLSLASL